MTQSPNFKLCGWLLIFKFFYKRVNNQYLRSYMSRTGEANSWCPSGSSSGWRWNSQLVQILEKLVTYMWYHIYAPGGIGTVVLRLLQSVERLLVALDRSATSAGFDTSLISLQSYSLQNHQVFRIWHSTDLTNSFLQSKTCVRIFSVANASNSKTLWLLKTSGGGGSDGHSMLGSCLCWHWDISAFLLSFYLRFIV